MLSTIPGGGWGGTDVSRGALDDKKETVIWTPVTTPGRSEHKLAKSENQERKKKATRAGTLKSNGNRNSWN